MAPITDIELAHGRMYVASLRGLTDALRDDVSAGGPSHSQVDPDTSLNVHTWDAALRSAGAAVAATDAVMAGELANAFCATRPPGHHACKDQAMGFCFFNNVAIAARYALERHGLKRVAIVDFDVHHGNGTENIVAGDQRILMVSFYQHPFYPECKHAVPCQQPGERSGAGLFQGRCGARFSAAALAATAGGLQARDDFYKRWV